MTIRTLAAAAALLGLAAGEAAARDPFALDLTVDGATGRRTFTSLENAVDVLSNNGLRSVLGNYTDVSAANAVLDLRGVPAFATFAANSTALRVVVPSAGINEVFQGATRDESRRMFQRFLEGRGGDAVNRLLRAGVRSSPIDPVAGGPNGAFAQIATQDFNRSVLASTLGDQSGFGIGARFGSFSAGGYNSRNFSLPLDYTWRITDRDTLETDFPLSYTDDAGASSYSGNLGVIYRRRVTDWWTLQPSVRLGAAGSVDLGAGSGVYGLGMNSTIRIPVADTWQVTIANGINYVATFPVNIGKYNIDYNISNTIFRNGIVVTHDLGMTVAGLPLTASAFAVDTRFTGSAVFIRDFQEFGVYVAAGREARGGLGVTVLTGARGLSGVTINTGVKF